ncbi:thioredoxin family protein, partial [Vibrio parahaemolyticus]|nr:thioredoxin family protein [Vibrio parahaemolyticus]
DKTAKVADATKSTIENFDKKVTWLVISESWCGDAAHVMPILNKVAELNDAIDYKIVLRDDNEALMDQFLTNGGKSIPKLIMLDSETNTVLN